jgi:hypothetical protein
MKSQVILSAFIALTVGIAAGYLARGDDSNLNSVAGPIETLTAEGAVKPRRHETMDPPAPTSDDRLLSANAENQRLREEIEILDAEIDRLSLAVQELSKERRFYEGIEPAEPALGLSIAAAAGLSRRLTIARENAHNLIRSTALEEKNALYSQVRDLAEKGEKVDPSLIGRMAQDATDNMKLMNDSYREVLEDVLGEKDARTLADRAFTHYTTYLEKAQDKKQREHRKNRFAQLFPLSQNILRAYTTELFGDPAR